MPFMLLFNFYICKIASFECTSIYYKLISNFIFQNLFYLSEWAMIVYVKSWVLGDFMVLFSSILWGASHERTPIYFSNSRFNIIIRKSPVASSFWRLLHYVQVMTDSAVTICSSEEEDSWLYPSNFLPIKLVLLLDVCSQKEIIM